MKRLAFAFVGAAALTVAGCNSGNQDQVNNAELNQPTTDELNQAASDAANDAANAEAAALGQQEQQLNANTDNNVSPSDAQEQNVAGM
jgi:predicted component of type VI protein secretion system